jgi:hypothetical protein
MGKGKEKGKESLTGVLPWPPVVAAGEDVAYDMFAATLLLLLLDDLRDR